MDISYLQEQEKRGEYAALERAIQLAVQKPTSPELLKFGAAYYVRRGKPALALACYSAWVKATTAGARDLEAVAWAIDCAKRMARPELVREIFLSLDTRERENLQVAALMHVAAAFISNNQLDEAEKILSYTRHKSGAKQLVTFSELITSRFGSIEYARKFAAETEPRFDKGDFYTNVKQAVNLALAHMAQGNYATAEDILLSCKATAA